MILDGLASVVFVNLLSSPNLCEYSNSISILENLWKGTAEWLLTAGLRPLSREAQPNNSPVLSFNPFLLPYLILSNL